VELYTIGFTQKSLRQFIGLLREAQVDGVVDIRLNNVSQLAGYAKRDDLAFVLELCGIGYLEEKRLAPTPEILDSYHRDHDWPAYETRFDALLAERPLADALAAISRRFERPCLLCAEPEPSRCHRRLVAEAFARLEPGLRVQHLVLARPKGSERTTVASAGRKRVRGSGRGEQEGRG
jgi:uncharacterized protein (DUF488 family)